MTGTVPAIDPRRTALLVMDFQAGILGRLSGAEALLSRVADAIAVVRGHGGQIGYVRVAFEDADYDAVPAHSRMAPTVAAAGRALHSDSPATAVHDSVAPEPGVHDFLTEKIFPRQAHVITIAELKDLLSAPDAAHS